MRNIKQLRVFNPCEEGLNYYSDWIGKGVDNIKDADVVLFTGNKTLSSNFNIENSRKTESIYSYSDDKQDLCEFTYMLEAINMKKPIVGVNKGMHMLHSSTNSPLVTHMQHPIIHPIEFVGSKFFCTVNSDHHQIIDYDPDNSEYNLIAFSRDLSPFYINSEYKNYTGLLRDSSQKVIEPEIVYYNTINAIGFQFDVHHMKGSSTGRYISRKLVDLLVNDELKEFVDLEVPIEKLINYYDFSIDKYKQEEDIEEYEQS